MKVDANDVIQYVLIAILAIVAIANARNIMFVIDFQGDLLNLVSDIVDEIGKRQF